MECGIYEIRGEERLRKSKAGPNGRSDKTDADWRLQPPGYVFCHEATFPIAPTEDGDSYPTQYFSNDTNSGFIFDRPFVLAGLFLRAWILRKNTRFYVNGVHGTSFFFA